MKVSRSKLSLGVFLLIADLCMLSLALYTAYTIRFFSAVTAFFPVDKGLPPWQYYNNILYFLLPFWVFIFYNLGFYKVYFLSSFDEVIRIGRAVTVGVLYFVGITFFYRSVSFSRLTVIFYWFISIFYLFTFREAFKMAARYVFWPFLTRENILIIGKENKVVKKMLKRARHYAGIYMPFDDLSSGNMEKIKDVIEQRSIKQVILTNPDIGQEALLEFYDYCEKIKIDLKIISDILQICRGEILIDTSLGIPIFHLKPVSLEGFNFNFKRLFDIVISIILISFAWPALLLIALLIKLDSPGSFFYVHKRMGYRKKEFTFYKFRTMVSNADALLGKYIQLSDRKGPVFKMSNDPRVTVMGKILRRYSVDEIPQIINVLKGEMSLIGPRPQVLWEAAAYDNWSKRRLRVLPGITGLWQVSGRAALSFEEMIKLDIFYIENWSLGMDIRILLKTIPAILSKKGAY